MGRTLCDIKYGDKGGGTINKYFQFSTLKTNIMMKDVN